MAMFFILRKWKVFIALLLVVCMLTMLLYVSKQYQTQTYVVLEHYNPDVRRTPVSGGKASHDGDPILRFATDHKDFRGFITIEPEKKEPQLSTETPASLTDNSSVIEREQLEWQDHSLPEERAPDKSDLDSDPALAVDPPEEGMTDVDRGDEGGGEDGTSISLSSDIDKRGEWQKQQVEAYCRKYGLANVEYQFPTDGGSRSRLFRHLLANKERKILFAFIPKVGCTNTRRFFHVFQGAIPLDTIKVLHIDEDFQLKYLESAIMKTSFLNGKLTDNERREMARTYYKYTIIRHPLERMVSAYKDKIEPPLVPNKKTWLDEIKLRIVQRFQAEEHKKWRDSSYSFPLTISFHVFARWVVESRDEVLNEHFVPITKSIYPCRIKYDFYGNFKQLVTDMRLIIDKFQAPHEYFQEQGYHSPGQGTQELLKSYFSRLDQDMKLKVFHEFYQDLDFYYHLYPEERTSHCQLLGIDELVE